MQLLFLPIGTNKTATSPMRHLYRLRLPGLRRLGRLVADTAAIIAAVRRAADAQADQQRRSHPT